MLSLDGAGTRWPRNPQHPPQHPMNRAIQLHGAGRSVSRGTRFAALALGAVLAAVMGIGPGADGLSGLRSALAQERPAASPPPVTSEARGERGDTGARHGRRGRRDRGDAAGDRDATDERA